RTVPGEDATEWRAALPVRPATAEQAGARDTTRWPAATSGPRPAARLVPSAASTSRRLTPVHLRTRAATGALHELPKPAVIRFQNHCGKNKVLEPPKRT